VVFVMCQDLVMRKCQSHSKVNSNVKGIDFTYLHMLYKIKMNGIYFLIFVLIYKSIYKFKYITH
jgi:hypothetical protein